MMDLKAATGHRCMDLGLLRGLLDSDRPPEGTEERRRFVKIFNEVLQGDPAYRKGPGI